MYKNLVFAVILIAFYGVVIEGTSRNESRCFQFTWLGPRFHNGSVFLNATCRDATRLAAGIPCEQPLVVSHDGSWPSVDYIWNNHAEQTTCVLGNNDVCARFTYYFNGHVENSTYMCTRAIDGNNTAIPLGCYEDTRGSFSTRVCLCRSVPGGIPCNSASTHYIPVVLTVTFVLMIRFAINGPLLWLNIFS